MFFFLSASNVMSTARSSLNIINFIVEQIRECNFAPQILHCDDTQTHTPTTTTTHCNSRSCFNETRLLSDHKLSCFPHQHTLNCFAKFERQKWHIITFACTTLLDTRLTLFTHTEHHVRAEYMIIFFRPNNERL